MDEKFTAIFDQAAEQDCADKPKFPSLREIWNDVADKFADKEAFNVCDAQHGDALEITIISVKDKNRSLYLAHERGEFYIKQDNRGISQPATAAETVRALGYFYGRYGNVKP